MPRNNYVAIDKMSAPRLASFADANAFCTSVLSRKMVWWDQGSPLVGWNMVVADADGPFILGVQNDF